MTAPREYAEPRYRYRTTRSGAVVTYRGDLPYGVPVTVRCGRCWNVFEDVLGDWKPCEHCGSRKRGVE